MQVLRWIVQQVYGTALFVFGAAVVFAVIVVVIASVAFGWELGDALAAWAFGG